MPPNYDYLSLYQEEEDFQDGMKFPKWILRNFTEPQMQQIRDTWRNEIVNGKPQVNRKLYELITF